MTTRLEHSIYTCHLKLLPQCHIRDNRNLLSRAAQLIFSWLDHVCDAHVRRIWKAFFDHRSTFEGGSLTSNALIETLGFLASARKVANFLDAHSGLGSLAD